MNVNLSLNLKDRVLKMLNKWKSYRDNDHKIIASIWLADCKRLGVREETVFTFLELYASGKLTNAESIRRIRQKLQEHLPHLQGEKRAKKSLNQSNIKAQLKAHGRDITRGTN